MNQSEAPLSKKTLKWYDRLASFCYEASTARLVGQLRVEAPMVFRSLVNEIDNPIAPEVETEIARYLKSPFQDELKPAETLMPRMMEKYGITSQQFGALERKQQALMSRRCNQCAKVSQCWQAMRDNAELEECERFCPNRESFDAISH